MWIISVVSLSIVSSFCVLGVFHKAFRDNLLQRIGMGGLCIGCSGRVAWIWQSESTNPAWMFVHVFMAVFALGTAQKVAMHHGRKQGWMWLRKFDRWIQEKQTAAGDFDDRPHHHWGAK